MEGYGPDKGVSPRAVAELFNIVESSKNEWSYALTFSMLEIYNESILDLLDKSPIKVAHSALLFHALLCSALSCTI
jgi:kinesin family member C2/C3